MGNESRTLSNELVPVWMVKKLHGVIAGFLLESGRSVKSFSDIVV